MKKKGSGKQTRFGRMRTQELAATAPYGREMVIDEFGPLSEDARTRWERARRKPGRPRRGKGAEVISVSVERELLSRSDMLAKNLGISRARLVERGLKAVLAAEGKPLAAMVPVDKLAELEKAARERLLESLRSRRVPLSQREADRLADEAKHRSRKRKRT
jgi:hypothetical protein